MAVQIIRSIFLVTGIHYVVIHSQGFPEDDYNLYPLYTQPDDVDSGKYDDLSNSFGILCTRPCENSSPQICYWKFILEEYSTLNQACGNCTSIGVCTKSNAPQCVMGDGYEKSILTVNRRMAGPSIQVCKGDTIVVDLDNRFPGRSASIHWHGFSQKLTPHMDGVPMITQCPILEETTFRYKFLADMAGTYFWHSHDGFQKMDGIIGSLIVRQPKQLDANFRQYDFDLPSHVILITDWFHNTTSDSRWPGLRLHDQSQLADTFLINGKGSYPGFQAPLAEFVVKPNQRYRFRFIGGTCLVCPFQVSVEGHKLKLISMDKSSVEPVIVDTFAGTPGERYDFVIETSQAVSSYWIHVKGIGPCEANKPYQLGILKYEGSISKTPPKRNPGYNGFPYTKIFNQPNADCNPDNATNVCISHLNNKDKILPQVLAHRPDMRILLAPGFYDYTLQELFGPNTYNRHFVPIPTGIPIAATINNISNLLPSSPLLSQYNDIPDSQFCSSECLANQKKDGLCRCLNLISLPKNRLVEIIIADTGGVGLTHPMHLHGYCYFVMSQGVFPAGVPFEQSIALLNHELNSGRQVRRFPPMKDTIPLPSGGYFVLRIFTDNPGFWFFHCHFLYHHMTGMSAVVQVGELYDMVPTPPGFPRCGNFLNKY